MLGVYLTKDLEERLDKLAGKTKRSKSYHAKKALQQYLEDREDYLLAAAALEEAEAEGKFYTWEEVKKAQSLMTNIWQIRLSPRAEKEFQALGKVTKQSIQKFIDNKLMKASNPTTYGTRLTGPLKHLWRYRVGDYRILAHHQKERVTILVVKIAHRSKVYR